MTDKSRSEEREGKKIEGEREEQEEEDDEEEEVMKGGRGGVTLKMNYMKWEGEEGWISGSLHLWGARGRKRVEGR